MEAARDPALQVVFGRRGSTAFGHGVCEPLGRGIDQWRPGEVPLAWIERFAEQRPLFAMFGDDRLIASVILAWADPFVWGDQQEPAGYVHMLMIDRAYAGRGLGPVLLD